MGGEDVARRGDSARIQGMVRSIDQYRNGQPKAGADGSYAQVLYALTDYKHDILVLWDFAVSAARQAEAMQREMAELRAERRMIVSHATMGGTDGEGMSVNAVSVEITRLRNHLIEDTRARTLIQGEKK